MHSVVRIYVQSQTHYFRAPLSANPVRSAWGSGWVCDALELAQQKIPFAPQNEIKLSHKQIEDKLMSLGIKSSKTGQFPVIITNAHVVKGIKSCSIQLEGDSAIHNCTYLCAFPGQDLALLLPPEHLIDRLLCNEMCSDPLTPSQKVKLYGYPKNGSGECSQTTGNLSRIISTIFLHANVETLDYEMTATINGGNSGGPVVIKRDDKELVVAIAHQHQTNAANQFHAIPIYQLTAAFRNYLLYQKDFGLFTQPFRYELLKNPTIRKYYHLKPQDSDGVVITEVHKRYDSPFKLNDILLQVNQYPVNSEGKITLFKDAQVPFTIYFHFLPPYEIIKYKILRAGKELDVQCQLSATTQNIYTDFRFPNQNPPIFYQNGLLFCGEVNAIEILNAFLASEGNKTPRALYTRISSLKYKMPNTLGTVVFFAYTDTIGFVLDEVNVFSKIAINDTVYKIRDIFHLFNILNPGGSTLDSSPQEKLIAFYRDKEDVVPFLVLPHLTKKEEDHHFEQYNIPKEFSPQSFREKHYPKSRGWPLLRIASKFLFNIPKKNISDSRKRKETSDKETTTDEKLASVKRV